ncbi:MAG: serine/threonine protein kinase, partial [Hymenobacteraceae bacterium]|nr:serine/threonine protein kinase [Hymenobacteraceae bacterium]
MADNHRIHASFRLPDRSYLGVVRRDITRLVESWGFDATDTGRVDIVVAELTSNLLKHTPHGGELLVRAMPGGSEAGDEHVATAVEILCLDRGPGMREPARMLEDGVPTAGSAGEGLGAIRRAADVFDLYTQPNHGTALLV